MQETPEVVLVKQIIEKLQEYVAREQPDFGDGKSILTMLYEASRNCNRMDDELIILSELINA